MPDGWEHRHIPVRDRVEILAELATMKRFQQSAALLGIIGLCACRPQPFSATESAATAVPVDSVVALGRLEPEGEVIRISVPNAQDSRVNQVLVEEGDWVKG